MKIVSLSEKLKKEMRHSWLSNGRQESVAEHTWRVSLIAILVEPYLDHDVHMEKLLKIIILHDLIEAEAGDVPAFDSQSDPHIKQQKEERELQAIMNIKNQLPEDLGTDLYELWMEFENKESYEARVANALDKLEAQIQHNEADLSTWLDVEKDMTFQLGKYVDFDSFLRELKDHIERDGEDKMIQAEVHYNKPSSH
ncbi:HD domain-containing protein [Pontibacillus salipaludis]|uniref:HD domain-containing protein n=1 Tax=Pontibacillus salipaludis TaxID=1697394 RepID=UPI0031E7CC1E